MESGGEPIIHDDAGPREPRAQRRGLMTSHPLREQGEHRRKFHRRFRDPHSSRFGFRRAQRVAEHELCATWKDVGSVFVLIESPKPQSFEHMLVADKGFALQDLTGILIGLLPGTGGLDFQGRTQALGVCSDATLLLRFPCVFVNSPLAAAESNNRLGTLELSNNKSSGLCRRNLLFFSRRRLGSRAETRRAGAATYGGLRWRNLTGTSLS